MRARIWVVLIITAALIALSACAGGQANRGPVSTPVPTKTLRPTFTHTPEQPTLTPTPAPPTATPEPPTPEAPTETPEPPTPEPTPTAEAAAFTVTGATLNVRSGPGTNYGVIGQLRQGQTHPITGKNPAGNWWQFDYNGRAGWVSGDLVRVSNGQNVQVAADIPAPPTARPVPTAAPRPPAAQPPPAPPPAAATKYGALPIGQYADTNNWVTVYCLLFDQGGRTAAGTLRVLREGQAAGPDVSFTNIGNTMPPNYLNGSGYNVGCKMELPAINGNYTAVLVEGGQVVSDSINFAVSGESNRITFVAWKQK